MGSCKNVPGGSVYHLPSFFPMTIFFITRVQYQNDGTDIGTIHRAYSSFSHFTCTHLYVCRVLYNFITCMDICNYTTSRYRLLHHGRLLLATSSYSHMYPSSVTPSLIPGKSLITFSSL